LKGALENVHGEHLENGFKEIRSCSRDEVKIELSNTKVARDH